MPRIFVPPVELLNTLRVHGPQTFQKLYNLVNTKWNFYTTLQYNIQIFGLILQKKVRVLYTKEDETPIVALWEGYTITEEDTKPQDVGEDEVPLEKKSEE